MTVTVTDPHAAQQADHIRRLLALGNPPATVAAAVGCTIARVLAVRDTPAGTPQVPRPRPARPRQATTAAPDPARLLAMAARVDDPRIAALAAHITADLADLTALVDLAAQRETAARALLAVDHKTAAVHAVYDNRHPARRRTDQGATA